MIYSLLRETRNKNSFGVRFAFPISYSVVIYDTVIISYKEAEFSIFSEMAIATSENVSPITNLAVISAKTLEGIFFSDLALQDYRLSFSLMLFICEAVLAVPLFLYIKKVYAPAVEKEPSGFEWRYLCLIPATFYVMWYYAFYGNISRSSLEIALRPKNTLFLIVINIGAALIYYIVTRLISEQNKSLELKEKNHQLIMQSMQYENLREKITDARREKHDVRHHIALMQEYLNNGEL